MTATATATASTQTPQAPPYEPIWELAEAIIASRSLHVVAELGVADHMGDGPVPTQDLAASCGADPDALGRVLRLLAAHGIFEATSEGYRHTGSSLLLRGDHPMSMRAFARLNGLPVFSATFAELEHSVRTGSPALEVIGGDFFTDPLPSCDAYLLMNILHDWDDEQASAVLAAVAKSSEPGAAVLVIETVMPERPEQHWAKTLDVLMLAVTGGRERTEAEYRRLLGHAGIDLVRTLPTATPFSVVEGRVR